MLQFHQLPQDFPHVDIKGAYLRFGKDEGSETTEENGGKENRLNSDGC